MTTRILVTGHNGFIGKEVFASLREVFGFTVQGLDRPDDIGDFIGPSGMFAEHWDCIIHLAAYAALRDSVDNPQKFWDNNVEKSKPIFDYCRQNNVRLLYASSAGAEEWWRNPYATTKKANELMAPPNSVGMRFFNVWAEEGSRDDMLYEMLKQGTARYLTRHKRDWIHVDDVCTAIAKLIYSDYTGTVDVGTGVTTSVLELANALIGENELPIQEWTPNEPDILKANPVVLREMGWVPTPFLDKIQSKCYTK